MRLGDEAASELQTTSEGQFVLTEVLMLETVDRLIMKRLALRPYGRWREQFRKLREAQRTPMHWGLDGGCALAPAPAADRAARHRAGDRRRRRARHLPPRRARRGGHLRRLRRGLRRAGGVADGGGGARQPVRGIRRPARRRRSRRSSRRSRTWTSSSSIPTPSPDSSPGASPRCSRDLQRRSRPGGVHVVLGGSRALSPDSIRATLRWLDCRRGAACAASAAAPPGGPTVSCSPSPRVPRTRRPPARRVHLTLRRRRSQLHKLTIIPTA